jgi:hypothetical protein
MDGDRQRKTARDQEYKSRQLVKKQDELARINARNAQRAAQRQAGRAARETEAEAEAEEEFSPPSAPPAVPAAEATAVSPPRLPGEWKRRRTEVEMLEQPQLHSPPHSAPRTGTPRRRRRRRRTSATATETVAQQHVQVSRPQKLAA